MKKSLVLSSLLMISGSALMAADLGNNWFIGTELGAMNIKVNASATSGGTTVSETNTIKASYEALKIGTYFDNSRVYGLLDYQNKKDDFSSWAMGIGYDYLIKNSTVATPFIGVNASYIKGNIDGFPIIDKPSGFAAGLEAGLIYVLGKNYEMEMGMRYMNVSNVKDSVSVTGASAEIKGKTTTQYYLGLNYKF